MKQSEAFYKLLDQMKEVHNAKRHDYASKEDVFKNFRTCEMADIPAWKGVAIRIGDKFSRLMSFVKQEELKVKDEVGTINVGGEYKSVYDFVSEHQSVKRASGSNITPSLNLNIDKLMDLIDE